MTAPQSSPKPDHAALIEGFAKQGLGIDDILVKLKAMRITATRREVRAVVLTDTRP
jgi:hypothetical protein